MSLKIQGPGGESMTTKVNYIAIYDPPKAKFSPVLSSGIPPITVEFTNLSTGDFDECLWDFGDGRTSTTCGNPTHEYRDEGHYTVSLTVKGPVGEDKMSEEECVKTAYLRIFMPVIMTN